MNVHEGHRKRVYERFLKEGLDNFSPHNVLELVLFYSIPRIDTNEIAHRLINRFGSVAGVFDAPKGELMKVEGVGERTAVLLKLIPQLARYYMSEDSEPCIIDSPQDAVNLVVPRFIGKKTETVLLVCLDNKNKIISVNTVHEGNVNTAEISVGAIASVALSSGASAVVLAHNHPDGVALPSEEDLITTQLICKTLKALNIRMVDHIVVGDKDYVSIAQSGNI